MKKGVHFCPLTSLLTALSSNRYEFSEEKQIPICNVEYLCDWSTFVFPAAKLRQLAKAGKIVGENKKCGKPKRGKGKWCPPQLICKYKRILLTANPPEVWRGNGGGRMTALAPLPQRLPLLSTMPSVYVFLGQICANTMQKKKIPRWLLWSKIIRNRNTGQH